MQIRPVPAVDTGCLKVFTSNLHRVGFFSTVLFIKQNLFSAFFALFFPESIQSSAAGRHRRLFFEALPTCFTLNKKSKTTH